jgi:Lon protease-like protein
MAYELPMFPLGSVLFPNTLLPLRVFEPRYQTLVDDCVAGDGKFGVVLIERGSEVGGGDTRFEIGTIAQIAGIADLEEGHRLVLAVGTGRFEVNRWLPDDPYPRAVISELSDQAMPSSKLPIAEAEVKLRRALALLSEAGYDVGDTAFQVSDEHDVAVDQLCALAPLSPLDAQGLLSSDSSPERLDRLQSLLDEEIAVLQQQLGSG